MSEEPSDQPRSSDAHRAPEGHTQERPAPDEAGKPGAPAPVDEAVAHDAADSHADAHPGASGVDHGHAEPALGPIDWVAWAYAAAGLAAGLLVAVLFWLKTAGG